MFVRASRFLKFHEIQLLSIRELDIDVIVCSGSLFPITLQAMLFLHAAENYAHLMYICTMSLL